MALSTAARSTRTTLLGVTAESGQRPGSLVFGVTLDRHSYSIGPGRNGRDGKPGTSDGPPALYIIDVISPVGLQWTLEKTFDDFHTFRDELAKDGVSRSVKAPFPRRRHFGHENVEANVLSQRQMLEAWLKEVVSITVMSQEDAPSSVQDFLDLRGHLAALSPRLSALEVPIGPLNIPSLDPVPEPIARSKTEEVFSQPRAIEIPQECRHTHEGVMARSYQYQGAVAEDVRTEDDDNTLDRSLKPKRKTLMEQRSRVRESCLNANDPNSTSAAKPPCGGDDGCGCIMC